ncbi:MAG: hypothetical protein KDA60_12040 [Planctomycetales bacterium]|nr:hypothetical protein [Planctomycetales bacterium]
MDFVSSDANQQQSQLVLAIDGGGTSCRLAVGKYHADSEQLELITCSVGGSANPATLGIEFTLGRLDELLASILPAVDAPSDTVASVMIGMAGVGQTRFSDHVNGWARSRFSTARHFRVTTDVSMLMTSADVCRAAAQLRETRSVDLRTIADKGRGQRQSVVLVAGTGSVALTRDVNGVECQAGGWGYLLGDEGSGYWIGRRALQCCLGEAFPDRFDALPSEFARVICKHVGVPEPRGLIQAIYGAEDPRLEIARVAGSVNIAAQTGNETARSILAEATGNLELLVKQLVRDERPYELIMAGGVLQHSEWIRSRLIDRLRPADTCLIERAELVGLVRAGLAAARTHPT